MKFYKRGILILLSGTVLTLQGCQGTSYEDKMKIQQLEEENKELENRIDTLENNMVVNQEVEQELENANLEIIGADQQLESEEEIVDHFEAISKEMDVDSKEEYYDKEMTIQNGLATFILFLNDEIEWNGYYFSDLKEESQNKILGFLNKVDEKINSIVPGYSEPILEAFSFIQEKGKQGILILNNSLIEAFGEEFVERNKQNFKDDYDSMIEVKDFWKEKILEKAHNYKEK